MLPPKYVRVDLTEDEAVALLVPHFRRTDGQRLLATRATRAILLARFPEIAALPPHVLENAFGSASND